MSIKDDIKTLLENSYELSRGEIIKKLGIDREQARKPITRLLEAKEIERRVDDNSVEWFCYVGEPTKREIVWKEEENKHVLQEIQEQCVEASQPSYIGEADIEKMLEKKYEEGWYDGCTAGREDTWNEIESAIGAMIRKFLGIGEGV